MSKSQWMKENLRPGEVYAGLILGKTGERDHHLILLPGEAERIDWKDAQAWAKAIGGELPTRREQALLYANLKEEFKPNWHWACEAHTSDSDFAWSQSFNDGDQHGYNVSLKLRARAVRKVYI